MACGARSGFADDAAAAGQNGDRSLTHAEIAAQLLRGAADFFRAMKGVSPASSEELETNAQTCEMMADRVETDPSGEAPDLMAEQGRDP